MKNFEGYRDFDLPVAHLDGEGRWQPARARSDRDAQIASINPEGRYARHQEEGIAIASRMLDFLSRHPDGNFSGELLSSAGLNSAWYGFARGTTEVMRRRLKLPVYHGSNELITEAGITQAAAEELLELVDDATFLAICEIHGHAPKLKYRTVVGRQLGNASLTLASVEYADKIADAYDHPERQDWVRRGAMNALGRGAVLGLELGADPTIDQLAHIYSPLFAHIQNRAPTETVEALEYAMDVKAAA